MSAEAAGRLLARLATRGGNLKKAAGSAAAKTVDQLEDALPFLRELKVAEGEWRPALEQLGTRATTLHDPVTKKFYKINLKDLLPYRSRAFDAAERGKNLSRRQFFRLLAEDVTRSRLHGKRLAQIKALVARNFAERKRSWDATYGKYSGRSLTWVDETDPVEFLLKEIAGQRETIATKPYDDWFEKMIDLTYDPEWWETEGKFLSAKALKKQSRKQRVLQLKHEKLEPPQSSTTKAAEYAKFLQRMLLGP